jgi:Uma2 family endonuclease
MATMTAQKIDLPNDGIITRADFEALPKPARGWAWELHSGRLELKHMPVTGWHWLVVLAALEYWRDRGHEILGEQYVADSGFVRGGAGKNNFVADGVVFRLGHDPDTDTATHDAVDVHAIIEAVSAGSEERDAGEQQAVYAQLGVPRYWIIRRESAEVKKDGLISMFELIDGEYRLVGHRLVSQLKNSAGAAE